jgi:acetylornithine deacetylase/succinyl-diaminopimelate desuccinylase-like protein
VERELQAIRSYLDANHKRHLTRLQTWLRQPSVSVDGIGGTESAALFVELLRDAGFPEAEVVRTPGIPGVWAAYESSRPVTLVTYGMLDVRRADPKAWRTPPFAAEVVDHAGFPRVLIARGARSVKGPLAVWLNAVEACRVVLGAPPINLLLLAEGDEILGSPHYRAMVDRYRECLAAGDACWSPGASQDADGVAHLTLGYKGLIYLAMRASGRRWGRGPQDAPVHGMAGSVVDSPAWRLVHALSSLTAPGGAAVPMDGFDGDAQAPTPEEAAEMEAVRRRFAGKPWQQVLPGVQGASTPAIGDASEDEIYRRYFFGSSVNLNGLRSGFLGPGTATFTLPHVAEAFLDVRVPRVWDVRRVLDAMRARLDGVGFADVELDIVSAFNGFRVNRDAAIARAAERLFAAHEVEVVWWPMTGGGGPWSIFAEEFGMPVLRDVGLGHGRASATDEYLVVEGRGRVAGLVEMALSHAEVMLRLAQSPAGGTRR